MYSTKLSVVIITYNEERNLGRCLNSVKNIADEIIIVDSFSKDLTEVIARSFDAQFYVREFEGHVAQKNYALSLAKYPLILSVDADEELDGSLINEITEIKKNYAGMAYSLNRRTYYGDTVINYSGWNPDWKVRVVANGNAFWDGFNPHDKLIVKSGKIKKLRGRLNHYSYSGIADHLNRNIKYAEIQAKDLFLRGRHATWYKRYLSPPFRFFKSYFFQLGFLDGYYGWIICWSKAYGAFHKYALLHELHARGPDTTTPPPTV